MCGVHLIAWNDHVHLGEFDDDTLDSLLPSVSLGTVHTQIVDACTRPSCSLHSLTPQKIVCGRL